MECIVVVVAVPVPAQPGVGEQHVGQPGFRRALLCDGSQALQVASDLALLPRGESGGDVGHVLVQRRPAHPARLGEGGHGESGQAVPVHEPTGSVEDRVPHRGAMFHDGVTPQLGHSPTLSGTRRFDLYATVCIDKAVMSKPSPVPRWVIVGGVLVLLAAGAFVVLHLTGNGMAGMH